MAEADGYYQILEVDKDASQADIKKAYRQKALKWHPDRNESAEAEEKFKAINEAYQVLSDPEKRKTYDRFGAQAFSGASGEKTGRGPFTYTYRSSGGSQGFEGFADPFEIFESFFGGGASPFSRRQRQPSYQINIRLKEAVTGTEKQVDIAGESKKIKIPAGVRDGSRIRFSDFNLIVRVKPDKRFKRRGQDLICEKKISFSQAALGGVVKLKNIAGEEVKFRIKSGTDSGKTIRLRGYGVPGLRGSRRGDLYVTLQIQTPSSLTSEQKKLLKQWDL